jgi:hypothetical protein
LIERLRTARAADNAVAAFAAEDSQRFFLVGNKRRVGLKATTSDTEGIDSARQYRRCDAKRPLPRFCRLVTI